MEHLIKQSEAERWLGKHSGPELLASTELSSRVVLSPMTEMLMPEMLIAKLAEKLS